MTRTPGGRFRYSFEDSVARRRFAGIAASFSKGCPPPNRYLRFPLSMRLKEPTEPPLDSVMTIPDLFGRHIELAGDL
jgi:hypothetical protein